MIGYVGLFILKPDGLFLFFFSKKKEAKNAAAAEKITKNQIIPLKENNSLCSNRFSFLTFHDLIFLTHFFKGGE